MSALAMGVSFRAPGRQQSTADACGPKAEPRRKVPRPDAPRSNVSLDKGRLISATSPCGGKLAHAVLDGGALQCACVRALVASAGLAQSFVQSTSFNRTSAYMISRSALNFFQAKSEVCHSMQPGCEFIWVLVELARVWVVGSNMGRQLVELQMWQLLRLALVWSVVIFCAPPHLKRDGEALPNDHGVLV
eukprot:3299152-Amphidinium_carterae.1